MRSAVMLLACSAALAACGGAGSGGGPDMMAACANDLPSSCPSPMPIWDGGVSALVTDKCAGCHRMGGVAATWPLTDYDGVYKLRQSVLDQVYSCYMPPLDAGQLDDSQRLALLGWLVCGAPNN